MPKIMLNSVEYTGGGGDSGMELTYDEYLALPEEEKTNGTTYYIKDINGIGEDQFQPIIYSEEEREIGVWIDGKPLYQKTIYLGTITKDANWHYLPHGINNIDKIVSCKGIMGEINNTTFTPIPNYRPSYSMGICIEVNQTDIAYMQNWIDSPSDQTYVTLQYTKTTDQSGSGTWTPQGVPAVHYDNTEKVVGTWFGETLYEKSYYVQGVKDSAVTVDSSITGTTVKLIEVKQIFFTTGGAYVNVWGNNSISSNMFLRTLLGAGGLGVNFDGYRTDYYGNDGFDVYLTIRYTKTTS